MVTEMVIAAEVLAKSMRQLSPALGRWLRAARSLRDRDPTRLSGENGGPDNGSDIGGVTTSMHEGKFLLDCKRLWPPCERSRAVKQEASRHAATLRFDQEPRLSGPQQRCAEQHPAVPPPPLGPTTTPGSTHASNAIEQKEVRGPNRVTKVAEMLLKIQAPEGHVMVSRRKRSGKFLRRKYRRIAPARNQQRCCSARRCRRARRPRFFRRRRRF